MEIGQGLADIRELPPGDDGSLADCRLGDDQAVGNLSGVGPGAIGEAIFDVVDLDGLVGRRPGQTDLDVLALDLVIELVPRDRDDINGPFPSCRPRAAAAHRIGSQVGVIVPLENQVHVMFVEDRDPGTPQLGIVSTGMRGIDRVVEHDKLPVGAEPESTASSHSASSLAARGSDTARVLSSTAKNALPVSK